MQYTRSALGASSDDLDVLRLNQGRSICRDVVLGPQRGQIIVQRLSALVGQRRIRPVCWTVVLDEEVDHLGGRKRILERIQVARDLQISHTRAETLTAGRLVTP